MSKKERELWERLANENPYTAAIHPSGDRTPNANLLKEIRGGSVLDIGVGWGRNSLYLQSKSCQVIGVDFSMEMLKVAKANGIDVAMTSATHLPFRNASFDWSICILVLQHLPRRDFPKAVKEILRVARRSVLQFPNAEDLDAIIRSRKSRALRLQPDRRSGTGWLMNLYTLKEVKKLIGRSCKAIGSDYLVSPPRLGFTIPHPFHIPRLARNIFVITETFDPS